MRGIILACVLLAGCGSSPSWETSERNEFMDACLRVSRSAALCRCLLEWTQERYSYPEWWRGDVDRSDASEAVEQCAQETL